MPVLISSAPVPTLLLVEDNPADAKLLISLLESEGLGATVDWVKNGEEAIAQLSDPNKGPVPAAVILDLNLPRRDGREVLSLLRTSPRLNDVPVIVLTSSNREEDILKVYEYSRVSFITKPIDLSGYEKLARRLILIELGLLKHSLPVG